MTLCGISCYAHPVIATGINPNEETTYCRFNSSL